MEAKTYREELVLQVFELAVYAAFRRNPWIDDEQAKNLATPHCRRWRRRMLNAMRHTGQAAGRPPVRGVSDEAADEEPVRR